jgi:hypothetical protein
MFWAYLWWSIEFLYVPPFAYGTVLVGVSLIASAIYQRPFSETKWRQTYSLVVLQFLFFPSTVAVAALGGVGFSPLVKPNYLGLRVEDAFVIGSLAVGACWIWRMRGLRWFATCLVMLQLWLLAGAYFIAGMALTGRWL